MKTGLKNKRDSFLRITNTKFLIFGAIVCIVLFSGSIQITEQGKSSNWFEMIQASAPDSVVFTIIEGKEFIGKLEVSLVSGENTVEGETRFSGNVTLGNKDGKMVYIYTNGTRFTTRFNVPNEFRTKNIKFETDNSVEYYNINKSQWE